MLALNAVTDYFFVNWNCDVCLANVHFALILFSTFAHFTTRSIHHHNNLLVFFNILIKLLQKVIFDTVMGDEFIIIKHLIGPTHNKLIHSILHQQHSWSHIRKLVHWSWKQSIRQQRVSHAFNRGRQLLMITCEHCPFSF